MQVSGELLLVSVLVAAVLAMAAWIAARSLVRGSRRDLIQHVVPSIAFLACAPTLYCIGSLSSRIEDSLCLICGKRSATYTFFGMTFERGRSPGQTSYNGPEYHLVFAREIGSHDHDWAARSNRWPPKMLWFSYAPLVRSRTSVEVWVTEFSSWPREARLQALGLYDEWSPHSDAHPSRSWDWAFMVWREQCLREHPEWFTGSSH